MSEGLTEGTKATADECASLLREVHDDATKREIIFGLRVESWKSVGVLTGNNFPADICLDEHDEHAMHWAIDEGGQLIAAARMCIHTEIHQLPDAGFFEKLTISAAPPFAAVNRSSFTRIINVAVWLEGSTKFAFVKRGLWVVAPCLSLRHQSGGDHSNS
jgi:hypothetical protein